VCGGCNAIHAAGRQIAKSAGGDLALPKWQAGAWPRGAVGGVGRFSRENLEVHQGGVGGEGAEKRDTRKKRDILNSSRRDNQASSNKAGFGGLENAEVVSGQ
jgi:hypothetical protein